MTDLARGGSFPLRVEFVCTGNLCRSPFAALAARSVGVSAGVVGSSGLWAEDGRRCPSPAVDAAARFQIDLREHRARRTRARDLRDRDWILVMEYGQLREVHELLPAGWTGHAVLLGNFLEGAGVEIPDPYGMRVEAYARIYRSIHRAVHRWAREVGVPTGGDEET